MSVVERTKPLTVEEVAWNRLCAALQEHRATFLQENGTLTLELKFHERKLSVVEVRTCVHERIREAPALT